jgi:myo-inositol-1(or 4)-monophosphatase
MISEALAAGAQLARRMFGGQQAHSRGDDRNQVVTAADLRIGSLLAEQIRRAFPAHTVIEEENGVLADQGRFAWVLDPIDGTSNFAAGSPLYAIMIGLLQDGEPVAGGVALPSLSETYLAERGGGLFRNGTRLAPVQPTTLSEALVAYGFDIYSPDQCARECSTIARIAPHCTGIRASNSAFDAVMTACGVYGAYINRSNRIWDCVAPHVLVQEGGGRYTTLDGSPIGYSRPARRVHDNFEVLASAAAWHDQLAGLLSAAESGAGNEDGGDGDTSD